MGNAQSCVITSVSVCSVYFLYIHIYSSHRALTAEELDSKRLPSFVYLYIKYFFRLLTRRTGHLHTLAGSGDVVFTVLNCRFEVSLLRSFCSAAGYGWDYPDTEYRDTTLCFPEFLCHRLLLMVLTDGNFRLSPKGLVRIHQSLKTLEPVDELKKGPFILQSRVLEYRQLSAGMEVDISLCATARTGRPVWESVLTLLSKKTPYKVRGLPEHEKTSQPDESAPESAKQVELWVPRSASLPSLWSFSRFSPYQVLFLPAWLFGRTRTSPSLWMLSVCLAEIEKHKGVEIITAPVNITAQFKEPLSPPGRVILRFWEGTKVDRQSSAQSLSFQMLHHGNNKCHVTGLISR